MNISGIRPYSGFYNYNEISKTELANTQPQEEQLAVSASAASPESASPESASIESASMGQETDALARQTFGAYDYANQYNPETTYELKGEESDILSLDVQKAISDMQKDQVLQQYQFFVGDTQTAAASGPELRGGENFSL